MDMHDRARLSRTGCWLANADLLGVLVQDAQVEGQPRDDDVDEAEPDPGRHAQEVGPRRKDARNAFFVRSR
jgi:hypothetical protein